MDRAHRKDEVPIAKGELVLSEIEQHFRAFSAAARSISIAAKTAALSNAMNRPLPNKSLTSVV